MEIVSFIVLVKEEGALWDKNEVTRALKPGAEKFCAKFAKCESAEKSCDLDTILPRSLEAIFLRGKIA